MHRHRLFRLACALLLLPLLLGAPLVRPPAARAADVWLPAAPLNTPRGGHTATPLRDGGVLVAGGFTTDGSTPTATERYDPMTGRWALAAPTGGRYLAHTATALADGRVLILEALSPQAEMYDPATDRWIPTSRRTGNGGDPVLLPDGRVLTIGGPTATQIELFDPALDRWTPGARRPGNVLGGSAALLPDGRVLVAGGRVPSGPKAQTTPVVGTDLYDPATDTWSRTGDLPSLRPDATALTLRDGWVLILGPRAPQGGELAVDLYDPATGRWTPGAALREQRSAYTATLLPDGQVLVVGGESSYSDATSKVLAAAERYDPVADRWTPTATLNRGRAFHTATPLADGRVLIAGGITEIDDPREPDRRTRAVNTAEFYADEDALPGACFPQTGQCVRGPFFDYWNRNGGLARNGFPLTGVRIETLEDGQAYQVQYFERVRLEYHPENPPPYDVLLGHFGRRVLRAQFGGVNNAVALFQQALAPAAPLAGAAYFPETGHNLAGDFLAYWQANGDLAQFGFPITEESEETLEDGNRYRVQYFERARFEFHPEHAGTPYAILLGQFGRRIEREATHLTGDFGRLYFADQSVRDRLGAPIEAARQMAGATQEFERGRMFYLSEVETIYWGGEAPTIYVFAGGAQSGSLDNYGPRLAWPDTWREGEEIGGGPGPQPGLFLPQRGFGKVWRLGSGLLTPNLPPNTTVRDRLGYALTADETGYRLAVQRFTGGFMLSTPDGRSIYAIFTNQASNGSALLGEYARYAAPDR